MATRIQAKRVYDPPKSGDGTRILVDRLWPRGLKKADAALDEWRRDVAPTPELRKWYGHDPGRFEEFSRRYRAELGRGEPAEAVRELVGMARRRRLTLLTATRDLERSGAAVLAEHLRARRG